MVRGELGCAQIEKQGKGDRRVTVPITDTIREILWPLRGHHDTMVFTYVASAYPKDPRPDQGPTLPDHLQRPQIGVEAPEGQGSAYPISGSTTSATTSRQSS